MKRFALATTTCGVFALAGLVSVGAQTAPPPSSDQYTQSRESGSELTVVGCLKSADDAGIRSGAAGSTSASATGTTSGTTGSATMTGQSSPGQTAKYVLTDAEIRSGASEMTGHSATGATSGSGPSAKKSDDDTFQLIAGSSSVNFEPHLNHQVEVRGTLDKSGKEGTHGSASGTTAGSTSGTTGSSTAASGSAGPDKQKGPRLRVTALRMLSSTCS